MKFSQLALLGASIVPALASVIPRASGNLPPIHRKGNAFFDSDGKRFYIRGVAYQPGGAADAADPLLDMESLKRDIELFKELHINTIRVYTIDNSENHDEAMDLLDKAGIYLALDANTPKYSLNRADKASLHASYNDVYLQSVFATIDAFAGYDNLLLFFSANEVINDKNNTMAAPYIKAVTRDMKQYISNHAERIIPVGYSSADIAENIESQALYFNCGDDDERADFFAFNDYSWCDPSDFVQSGWNKKVETYKDYSIPLFLSEYGCNTNTREWEEVESLYHDNMTHVYSGGLAYEFTTEPNGYGLVEDNDGTIEPNKDFERLAKKNKDIPLPEDDGGFSENKSPSKCPPKSDDWNVDTDAVPAIPSPAKKYMDDGAGEGPGLAGKGSQWAGTPSDSTATPGSGNPTRTPSGGAAATGTSGSNSAAIPGADIPVKFLAMVAASMVFGGMLLA